MDTIKLVNTYRETGGSWTVADIPNDVKLLAYIKRELAAYQQEEPAADWHLETRGTVRDWHRWGA